MKLTKELLREMIDKQMKVNEATSQSVMDRINIGARPDNPARQVDEFVIMSSDRGERSDQENKKIYESELLSSLREMGLQYTPQQGSWVETDEETGEKRRVTERSVIFYKDQRPDKPQIEKPLFQVGKELSDKFDQEAFIYGRIVQSPEGEPEREIKAYDAQGKFQSWGGPWQSAEQVPEDEAFWSRVRGGKTFQFKEEIQEEIEVEAPNSVIEAMRKAEEHKGKKIKFVRSK